MPRNARLILPHSPHLMIQRGHNRHVVFAQDADETYDLETLKTGKIYDGVKVYALCLMTNHVHLLLEPDDTPEGLAQLMKR